MTNISKAVLVTGCSSGIGEATARRLAEHGWSVWATARRPETVEHLAGEHCRVLALDVTDEHSMRTAVDTVVDADGAVGVLVNNAGYSQSGAVESVAIEDVRRQFETNVFGLLRLTQLVLPGMRAQHWGKVVNLSSMGGRLTFPGGGVYHATKHAVEALSDALRFEVRDFGIDVVCVQPGLIRTGFAEVAAATMDQRPAAVGAEGTDVNGVYDDFNRRVAEVTREAYDHGPLAPLGGGPDQVAEAIEAAIGKKHSPTRVPVTWSARVLMAQRRLLPDPLWDRFLGFTYPRPH